MSFTNFAHLSITSKFHLNFHQTFRFPQYRHFGRFILWSSLRHHVPGDNCLSTGIGMFRVPLIDFECTHHNRLPFQTGIELIQNEFHEFGDDGDRHTSRSGFDFAVLLLRFSHIAHDQFECSPCIFIELVFVHDWSAAMSTDDSDPCANQTQFQRLRHHRLFDGSVPNGMHDVISLWWERETKYDLLLSCCDLYIFLDC